MKLFSKNLVLQVHPAEELLRRASEYLDRAIPNLNDTSVAEASIAVAEASLLATNKLFELAGTKFTLQQYNYDATGAALVPTHCTSRCAGNTTLLATICSTMSYHHAIAAFRTAIYALNPGSYALVKETCFSTRVCKSAISVSPLRRASQGPESQSLRLHCPCI